MCKEDNAGPSWRLFPERVTRLRNNPTDDPKNRVTTGYQLPPQVKVKRRFEGLSLPRLRTSATRRPEVFPEVPLGRLALKV